MPKRTLCFTWTWLSTRPLCCTWTCLPTRALCCTWTCLPTEALCCTWTCLSTIALCCTCTCLSSRGCAALARVCLHELCAAPGLSYLQELCAAPVDLSAYKNFVRHLDVAVYKSLNCPCWCQSSRDLCCTWTWLSIRACTMWVSVYKSFVLHLEVSAYKSPAHAVPVGVRSIFFLICFRLFRNRCFFFSCFDTCSKHRNKPKTLFFGFVKQTEEHTKQIYFRFFSVQIENIFCLFWGIGYHL